MPEPKLLPSLGITFLLCYVALSRARGGGASRLSSHAHRSSSSRQKPRKRGGAEGGSEQQCQGFLDLIRNESQLRHEQRETKPSLTRKQLGEGRLVVVIIGPASTGVHQRYVVEKLLRYLRWSNLIRRHFLMTPDDLGSTARDGASSSAPRDNLTDISSSRNRENGRHTRWTGNVLDTGATPGGKNGSLANGNGHGSGGKNGDRQRGTPAAVRQTQGYTYSDRGKAAALETIAAQESAKKVAAWLNGLSAGGVAVVEARGSGWASTRHGREGLPGFLRQTAGPDVGVLWVEVLPSGLYHHGSSSCSNGGSSTGADDPLRSPTLLPYSSPLFTRTGGSGHPQTAAAHRSSGGTATGAAETTENGVGGAWKSVNGLPRGVPKGLGGNVVDTFLQSGSLVGAGGHVIYESVRRGARGGAGGAGGKGKSCFVSLADQGLDVQSQLQYEACPLAERVGTFAGALRMKKSWHGCPVYLTRHGESLGNQTKSMGGDGNLSETGDRYAGVLADFVAAQLGAGQSRLLVWCSPMKRATQTARAVKCHRYSQWQALTELDTGVFNGCSYKQVERDYPDEFTAREVDKLCYRYPEGEGYLDVVNRLDPVVVALEKEDRPVIVVSHQAVLRCLYAYFHDISLREMPRIPISLHTVVKLTPVDYHPEASAAGAAAGAAGGGARFWKELRFELIQQTPLQHLNAFLRTDIPCSHTPVA